MKIKIIELLNKIYNHEDMPRKIIFDNRNWLYNDKFQDYFAGEYNSLIDFLINDSTYDTRDFLNTEIEIKEEDNIFNRDIKLGNYLFSDDGCFYLDSDTANTGKTRCEIIPGCTVGAKDLDIPENKKIKKLSWQQVGFQGCYGDERTLKDVVLDFNEQNNKIGKKINELVKEINKLKEITNENN